MKTENPLWLPRNRRLETFTGCLGTQVRLALVLSLFAAIPASEVASADTMEPAAVCTTPAPTQTLAKISLNADSGTKTIAYAANPLPNNGHQITSCWLSLAQYAAATSCAAAVAGPAADNFGVGYCTTAAPATPSQPHEVTLGVPNANIESAQAIYVRFAAPNLDASQTDSMPVSGVLQMEDPGAPVKQFVISAIVNPAAQGPKSFRVHLYAGYNYLYSIGNFSQAFPEFELHTNFRLLDGDKFCPDAAGIGKTTDCNLKQPSPVLRLYAEAGLSSTTATANPNDQSSALTGTRTFFGDGGLAVGYRSTSDNVILAIARLGGSALPSSAVPASVLNKNAPDLLPVSTFYGLRYEPEADLPSQFQGLYFEVGAGQSNQFTYQKSGRLKMDAFVPLSSSATHGTLAFRIQVDGHWLKAAPPALVKAQNLSPGAQVDTSEIKLSLLWNTTVDSIATMLGLKSDTAAGASQAASPKN